MFEQIGLIINLLKIAPEVIKAIQSIIEAVQETQEVAKGKPAEEKKAHAKKILENKGVIEVDFNNLDGAIDFTKSLLRKNGVI